MYLEDRVVETGFSFSNDVPQPEERRSSERHIKILRVGTIVVDGRRELCLIRNISAGGVRAQAAPGQREIFRPRQFLAEPARQRLPDERHLALLLPRAARP